MRIPAETTPHQLQEAPAGPVASLPPLWWLRRFPGQASQVAVMRSWIARLLPACDPLDDLLVLASELASNAVTHTRSGHRDGWFTVEVTWTSAAARVVVGDQGSDEVPASQAHPGGEAAELESGRGLLLVGALSAAWGIAGDAEARWLWAEVGWRSRGGPLPVTRIGSKSTEAEVAAILCPYPGLSAWYGTRTGQWHARLPGAPDSGILSAPSPVALACMLSARYPRPGTRPDTPRPERHPDMTQPHCTCGYQAEDSDDLAIHFGEMFIPDDDTALDGQVHNEAARDATIPRDTREPLILTCRCGFAGTPAVFDHHLLDVFTPADAIGTDGKRHVLAPQWKAARALGGAYHH